MTLAHALLLMVETFGGAVLMLGLFWTIVTVADLLRLEQTPPYGTIPGSASTGSPLSRVASPRRLPSAG